MRKKPSERFSTMKEVRDALVAVNPGAAARSAGRPFPRRKPGGCGRSTPTPSSTRARKPRSTSWPASLRRSAATRFALVALVTPDRLWAKASAGGLPRELPRSSSFCTNAILSRQAMVVPDAREDERFRDDPLVSREPAIRFYAGAPLRNSGWRGDRRAVRAGSGAARTVRRPAGGPARPRRPGRGPAGAAPAPPPGVGKLRGEAAPGGRGLCPSRRSRPMDEQGNTILVVEDDAATREGAGLAARGRRVRGPFRRQRAGSARRARGGRGAAPPDPPRPDDARDGRMAVPRRAPPTAGAFLRARPWFFCPASPTSRGRPTSRTSSASRSIRRCCGPASAGSAAARRVSFSGPWRPPDGLRTGRSRWPACGSSPSCPSART